MLCLYVKILFSFHPHRYYSIAGNCKFKSILIHFILNPLNRIFLQYTNFYNTHLKYVVSHHEVIFQFEFKRTLFLYKANPLHFMGVALQKGAISWAIIKFCFEVERKYVICLNVSKNSITVVGSRKFCVQQNTINVVRIIYDRHNNFVCIGRGINPPISRFAYIHFGQWQSL